MGEPISTLREAGTALKDTEETYRFLVEAVQDYAIFALDPKGRIVTWNAGARRIKGYSKEEAIGQHFSLFYTKEDIVRDHPRHELELASQNGVYEEEGWRVRKDGSRFWASVVITALRDRQGTLKGFAKVTRDLTQRKVAEEKLRQSEARLRLMITSIKDYAILSLDPTGHVTSWNLGAERLKGYSADEVIGQHFSKFYPREEIEAGKPEHELKVAAKNGSFEDEGWRVRKDGSLFWANVIVTAMRNEEGQLIGFSKVTRDLSARKLYEEEIKKANVALQASNRELEAFSYSVSHDLRAPLRGIDGFSQALLEDYGDKLDATGKQYLQFVREGTQKMGKLIDDLLNLSRLSRTEMKFAPVDLSLIARGISQNLRKQDPKRNVAFRIQDHVIANGDSGLLSAALENLLGNAWKFTSKVPEAVIEFGSAQQNERTVYFVRDNGVGFDMKYYGKLFGAFQRLHSDSDFKGTGVGLATVRRVVRRHGGEVWAESKVGVGTTFYFTLQL